MFKADGSEVMQCYDGPWFICTMALILLQHGIDPNLYRARDVIRQIIRHNALNIRKGATCVSSSVLFETFLAAGYKFEESELSKCYPLLGESRSRELYRKYGAPATLKHLSRSAIRTCILSVNNDTSVFSSIDKLTLPNLIKDYLKLSDVVPLDIDSIICYEHR